jgi:hypothetical protein
MGTSFIETLKAEVARLQAGHPDRADEIGRANALILQGMVSPTDDPTTARVLSSDGTRQYEVNGRCNCQAGLHGKSCKHTQAWKLYQHVLKKHGSPRVSVEPISPLPEARASLNFKAMVSGFEVQVTLRGDTEEDLLKRLQALLKRQDIRPVPKPAPRSGSWRQRQYQGR